MIKETEFDFPQALKRVRESRGMMQKDLGAAMGIDPNRISNWESGYNYPTLPVFRSLCVALNCPPGELLGLSPSGMSGDEYSLIKGYRNLNHAGRYTMMALLETQLAVASDPTTEE